MAFLRFRKILLHLCEMQGSRLAVSRYPRDTRFQIWILDIIGLVSRRDTKKISKILTKNSNIYEVQTSQRSVRQNNIFSLFVARNKEIRNQSL